MPAPKKINFTENEKRLIRRYLVWCFKTTKESLERIDRKHTQLVVDRCLFDELNRIQWPANAETREGYKKLVDDFKDYMDKKEKDLVAAKFVGPNKKQLKPDYIYLKQRLQGIERAIVNLLGKKELASIEDLYEKEMTQRILQAREHS